MLVTLLLPAGCMTTYDSRARREVNEREDRELANEQIRRLEGDIESLQMRIEDLQDASERTQANAAFSSRNQVSGLQDALQSLEQRVARLEESRQTDMQNMIDKVADMLAASPPTTTVPQEPRPPASGYGYEHVVQPGENLSRIAQAYEVSMAAIVEANNLKDPNALRVGQTLFIPE